MYDQACSRERRNKGSGSWHHEQIQITLTGSSRAVFNFNDSSVFVGRSSQAFSIARAGADRFASRDRGGGCS